MKEKFLGIPIELDVATLYNALHLAHGQIDDSPYAKKVCDYYSDKIKSDIKKTGILSLGKINVSVTINDTGEIQYGLNILKRFLKFLNDLDLCFEKRIDLSQFDAVLPHDIELVSENFESWIKYASDRLSVLPFGECYYSKDISDNHVLILLGQHKTSYEVSQSDILELDKYLFITDNCKLKIDIENLNPESKRKGFNMPFANKNNQDNDGSIAEFRKVIGNPLVKMFVWENNNPSSSQATDESKRVACRFASEYASKHSNIILSGDTVLQAMLGAINNEVSKLTSKTKDVNKKGMISLLIGGLAFLITLVAVIVLTFVLKPDPFVSYTFATEGVWTNIWKCTLTVLSILVASFLVGWLAFAVIGLAKVINYVPFIPKGIATFILVYFVYIYDFSSVFASNLLVPYRIIGTACIVLTIAFGLTDVITPCDNDIVTANILPKSMLQHMRQVKSRIRLMIAVENIRNGNERKNYFEKDDTFFTHYVKSTTKGRVFYTNVLVFVPVGLFFAYTWILTYLAVAAVWVSTVFLLIGFIWVLLCLIMAHSENR